MKETEFDPALRFVNAVLGDLAVRTGMYVGRRESEGDAETFVIQAGEGGRSRLGLPDLDSDASIEQVVAEAQAYLEQVLGAPVPLCPVHDHALRASISNGELTWGCPNGGWSCALGEYEERTWPQLDATAKLPEILMRRLKRRGTFPTVVMIGVKGSGRQRVADFGVIGADAALLKVLSEVSAPLPVTTREAPGRLPRRIRRLSS